MKMTIEEKREIIKEHLTQLLVKFEMILDHEYGQELLYENYYRCIIDKDNEFMWEYYKSLCKKFFVKKKVSRFLN